MNILFITLSNIGDAVMTTPVIIYLLEKYPNAKFDIVCDKKSYEVFKYFPNVNSILIKQKNKGFFYNLNFIKKLRLKNYDYAIDLRTDFLLFFIKAREKFFKVNNKNIHSVIKHFSILKVSTTKVPHPFIFIPKLVLKNVKNLIPRKSKKIISIAIGAKSSHKIWPIEQFINLIKKIDHKFDIIILVGDRNDHINASLIYKIQKTKILNLCGKTSLIETAAIIKHSSFFIGNDSGLGHLASAVKTPSFTIFGEGSPKRYAPWGEFAEFYQNYEHDISLIPAQLIIKKLNKSFLKYKI